MAQHPKVWASETNSCRAVLLILLNEAEKGRVPLSRPVCRPLRGHHAHHAAELPGCQDVPGMCRNLEEDSLQESIEDHRRLQALNEEP